MFYIELPYIDEVFYKRVTATVRASKAPIAISWTNTNTLKKKETRYFRSYSPALFPDATKMLAIVAEKFYQKTCQLTNNQTGTAITIFMLFVALLHYLYSQTVIVTHLFLAFNWLHWPKLAGKQRMLFGKGNKKLIAGKFGCDWHPADSTLCLQPLQQISRKWIHCGSRCCASSQYLVACLVFEQKGKSVSPTLTWCSDWTE